MRHRAYLDREFPRALSVILSVYVFASRAPEAPTTSESTLLFHEDAT